MSPESDVPVIQFPLRGEWYALPTPGHSDEEWDLTRLRRGRLTTKGWLRHLFTRVPADSFYAWGQPIFAPFDGVVTRAHDGEPDHDQINLVRGLIRVSKGTVSNHVLLESDGVFALLVHFERGSVQVETGEAVQEGQLLGRVGNSGRSWFPHLHMQLMDGPDFTKARLLPFKVKEIEHKQGKGWKKMNGDGLTKGGTYRFPA
ncbi:MAG: M23 family metallopeptidase [Anaerolineales bacterium]|nr:M23 family metallopeptidase [Anaerolineales bacterium]